MTTDAMMEKETDMNPATKKKGLGRGLSALLGDEVDLSDGAAPSERVAGDVLSLPIERVTPHSGQPRTRFDDEKLNELADSIAEKGVLQPILVRPYGDGYQIIAGERRWRAAQKAQLDHIPAIVKPLDDAATLEVAIIENIQRADLNPIDEAMGYAQLIEAHEYTQEQLSRVLSKSRSHIANTLRLTKLPEDVRDLLADGRLSVGQARPLIGLPNASALAKDVLKKGLTAREVEKIAMRAALNSESEASTRTRRAAPSKDADTLALEGDLSAALGAAVSIRHQRGGGGEITIRYKDLDGLDDLCGRLGLGQGL